MDIYQLTSPLILPLVSVWLIQHLKASQWRIFSWVTTKTPQVSRLLSIVLSGLAAAHITWTWNAVDGVLTIKGLMWSTILSGLYTWVGTFATNEFAYTLLQINQKLAQQETPPAAPPVR